MGGRRKREMKASTLYTDAAIRREEEEEQKMAAAPEREERFFRTSLVKKRRGEGPRFFLSVHGNADPLNPSSSFMCVFYHGGWSLPSSTFW